MCCRYPLFVTSGYNRLRRQSANTRHCHRQIVLCSTTSDSECAALSSTTRPVDTNPCFGCQQGRLLLFRAGRCLRSSTGHAAVHPQRCRPTRVLSQALRTLLRDLHWLRVPEWIQLRLCVLAFRSLDRSAPPYLAQSVRRTADVDRSSPPPIIYHHDACCPVSAAINSWRPLLSCRCIAGMEQPIAYHQPSELFHPSPPFGNN